MPDRFEHVEAVALLQLQVQHDHVALQIAKRVDRGLLGITCAYDLNAGHRSEGLGEALAQNGRIFDQEDP
jgi:hypothetical protein